MDVSTSLVEGVIVLVAIIALAVLLKKINILNKNDELLFSHIVFYFTDPIWFQ